ncbi:GA-like domain-containing protein [Rodentibacter pneumotropicus]|uniref:GA-like domain-containing protein n=2 Tax=Rodentibacter pneumotropicus TaxID=758 RepID=UPI000984651B|nr:hypothetical protein [Rodentibacter pneumotropicus]OOF60908.1 hypothetical protein BKL50_08955 [Rodentibacter pneumotropicus]
MSTTLKVLSAKKVIANYQINQGEQLIIEARAQSNYQLVDDKTGFAPDNIITKRDGKDLKIYLNDGDMSEDIIIKDYYGDEIGETTNLLVGKHENGSIYAYIPESGLQPDAVSLLADQAVAPQALGGEELVSAFWAFNPWWLLALAPLAAGIAIAAHDGGNNSGGGDLNTQADAATKLVEEAEAKAKALDDKIKELEADGNISAEDKAMLDALKADADAAKAKADEAMKGLPADNAAKDGLQGRVDAIDNRVPDVTPDPADGATKLVEDAEAKVKALDDKIKELEADGNISAEDKATLDALKADADVAKAKADEAVKGLPADNAAKEGLQDRVDAIDNRVPDMTPDPATKLVEEAEAKAKALDDRIKELEADGNISAEDKATLDALKADADAAKAKADEAVKGLPADNAAKEGLQGRVDAIDNSVPDMTPDPAEAATKLVEEAEAKAKALDDKIKELEADGNISAEDKATLDALKADADAAKAEADEAVKALPADNAAKEGLQGRVDAIDNSVPDMTPDPAEAVTKLVEEAEAKAKALDDKIKELEADGNISAEDKATLDALKADADAAKAKADEAVKGLPADNAAKEGLQGRVDAIDNRVPDVTPDQTDSSNWGVDTDGWIENDSTADNPPDTDPSDESGEDNTPQLDPMVIVTGRTVLSNPTNAVMTKIRDKNLNVPTTQIQKVGSQAQFVTGEEDNTVVVGKGDRDNISGKNSITNGLIQTNGGSDKVVITNNSINTVIDTGADNDSVDIYGNLRHTGATAPESKIDTGNGDDVLTIRGRITGLKNQLMMGDGDDTVIVAGGATGNTTAQNNMQTKTNWNAIDLGEGNDKLSMGEKGPGNIQYTDIQAGIGDDVVILKPNRGKGDLLWVNVDLGDGNDSIVVAATDIRNVYISGGAGNDTIDLSASSTQTDATRSRVISSKVDGGEGNDHIILGKIDYVDDYPVDVTGGAGDDVITFTQDYAPFLTSNRIGASISGGDGFDTVAIKGTAMISLASGTAGTQKLPEGIINFESIDMTASGGQTVKLTASDVLANSGMLYIAGDSSDTVDLGNDGSSSLGGFTKTAETTARIALDGKEHTYTAYTNGDVKVYIDDQITNII